MVFLKVTVIIDVTAGQLKHFQLLHKTPEDMLRIFITPEQLLHIPTFPPRHRDGLKLRTIHSLVKYHIVVVVVLVKQSFNCYFTCCHVDYSLFFPIKALFQQFGICTHKSLGGLTGDRS